MIKKTLILIVLFCIPIAMLSESKADEEAIPEISVYTLHAVDVYNGPIFSGNIKFQTVTGAKLIAFKRKGNWLKVKDDSGKMGWISESWVTSDMREKERLQNEEKERLEKISQLEAEVRPIPASNAAMNLSLYRDLLHLDPSNSRYRNKVKYYESKIEAKYGVKDTIKLKNSYCYELGYSFGRCAARSMKGLQCEPGTDISIPIDCRNKAETQRGIDDGVRSVY